MTVKSGKDSAEEATGEERYECNLLQVLGPDPLKASLNSNPICLKHCSTY